MRQGHILADESKNGCYVNGTRIKRKQLQPGDVIIFGGPTGKRVNLFLIVDGLSSIFQIGEFIKQLDTEFAFIYEEANRELATGVNNELIEMYEKYDREVR